MSNDAGDTGARLDKYGHLPAHVRVEDTITSQETAPAREPEEWQKTDRE